MKNEWKEGKILGLTAESNISSKLKNEWKEGKKKISKQQIIYIYTYIYK